MTRKLRGRLAIGATILLIGVVVSWQWPGLMALYYIDQLRSWDPPPGFINFSDYNPQNEFSSKLIGLGAPAIGVLASEARDKTSEVRVEAVWAIGWIASPDRQEAFRKAHKSPFFGDYPPQEVLHGPEYPPDRVVPLLIDIMNEPFIEDPPTLHMAAVFSLSRLGCSAIPAIPHLLKLMDRGDYFSPDVAWHSSAPGIVWALTAAFLSLGDVGLQALVDAIDQTKEPEFDTTHEYEFVLEKFGDKAVRALTPLKNHKRKDVREAVTHLLDWWVEKAARDAEDDEEEQE